MNRLLLQLIRDGLESAGLEVPIPRSVPINDGCIAYGQAAIARQQMPWVEHEEELQIR